MMDLKGRTIRTSHFNTPEGVTLKIGMTVEFRTDGVEIESSKEEIQINYYDLPPVMREGDIIIFGDNGQVQGEVKEISRTSFQVEIMQGGQVTSNSVIKVPGLRLQALPVLQLQDKLDIKEIAAKHRFDYVVIPAVQIGRDIQEVKLLLGPEAAQIQVIAKIDTLDAVQNFASIIK
jgi:pyruvate kinase